MVRICEMRMVQKEEGRGGKTNQRRRLFGRRAVFMLLTALLMQLLIFFTTFAVKAEDEKAFGKKTEKTVDLGYDMDAGDRISGDGNGGNGNGGNGNGENGDGENGNGGNGNGENGNSGNGNGGNGNGGNENSGNGNGGNGDGENENGENENGDEKGNENGDNDNNAGDKEPPEIQIRWNGTGREHYWYRGKEAQFEFVVTAKDNDEDGELLASIYCGTAEEEIEDVSDKKEGIPVTDGQVSFGSWVYNREGTVECGDQRRTYVVIVEDQAGNAVKSEAVEVRIDETGPELAVYDGHPAVYYQFANAVHEKMNDRDRVQACQIGAYLFQETLLSRTAVTLTVNVTDEAAEYVSLSENAVKQRVWEGNALKINSPEGETSVKGTAGKKFSGSGIEKAVLKVNGQSFEPVEKPDGRKGEGTYRFQLPFLPGEEVKYCPEALELTDRAGNRTVYRFGAELAPEVIVVDGKIPEVDFSDEAYTVKNREGSLEWYSVPAQGQELRITANARDRYGIYSMEWYMTDEEGNITQGPLTAKQPGKAASVPEQASGAFEQPVLSGTALFRAPQTQLYAVRAIDWAGNATGLIPKRDISQNNGSQVNIDNQPAVIAKKKGAFDVAYCFSNIKYQEKAAVLDQELTEQEHLVDGRLVSGTDVRVTVTAEDLPEVSDARASGLKEAVLVTGRGEYRFSLPGGAGEVCGLTLTGAEGGETVYECKSIRITDNAGNVTVCPYTEEGLGSLTVVVDKKSPVQPEEGVFCTTAGENDVRTADGGGLTGWYSAADGTGKTICAEAEDVYGISSIKWYALKEETDGRSQWEGSLLISETENPDEGAGSFACSETFFQDQDQLYGVEATDWAGNRACFQVNESGGRGSRVRIDNEAPQETVFVQWETCGEFDDGQEEGTVTGGYEKINREKDRETDSLNNREKSGVKEGEYGELTEHVYEMPGKGAVYGRDHVALKLYVRDELREGMRQAKKDLISSEVQKILVTVNHDGKKEVLVKSNGSQTRRVQIGGEEYLEFVFPIAWDIPEQAETEKYIENIRISDCAGNAAPALARPLGDGVRYILDSRPPEWKVNYHPESYVEHEKYPDTYFYRDDGKVDVCIRERYFFPEDGRRMQIDCQADGASEALERSSWEGDGEEHRSVFSMPKDGTYRFTVGYEDRSGNLMEGEEVSEGRFASKNLVLDTKEPVIEAAFLYNGVDITKEIAERKYYGGPVTVEVKITEVNFDPDLVELKALGYSSENHSAAAADWDGPWSDEGEGVHRNTVTFAAQGAWRFYCGAKDIVGWEAKAPDAVEFVIDTLPPTVEIGFDRNNPEHEIYYREARTAFVRVTDRTFHPEEAKVFLTASGQKPAQGEWRHLPGDGCTGEENGHVDGCVYEMRMTFAQDGDYTLAFQCADRAGNKSVRAEAAPFTIDRTPPEVTVAYDNTDAAHGLYYNRRRRAVITVEEHNFRSEDVTITITAERAGKEIAAPLVSGWTGAEDRHSASVLYDYDGEFTFHIACKDLAGNQGKDYPEDHFIIDLTPPKLEIMNIRNKSANNQEVAPGIRYSDEHLNLGGIAVRLSGAGNGEVDLEPQRIPVPGGQVIQYENFPRKKEMDDLYTLFVSVSDLAGNVSEETVLFSVNRFGSVYQFDSATQEALDRYYLDRPTGLKVTEINVDTLEFREVVCSRDGELRALRQGEDYQVIQSGSKEGWKAYTYEIGPDNFQENGIYTVTIYSEDRASNHSSNGIKEKEIAFAVDTAPPTVVVTGVEDHARYYDTRRIATIDVKDNLALFRAEVWLNDNLVRTFDQEELSASGGAVTFLLQDQDDWQTLYVKASDAAGNAFVSEKRTFLITKNLLIQWYQRPWLFWGSVAALTVLLPFALWLAFYRLQARKAPF